MKKKVLLLSMVLVLAFAAVGIGYAGWTKTLNISGTVATGNVDLTMTEMGAWDTDDELGMKDFSGIVCVVDGDTLTVTVTNAYPCIDYYNKVNIHCSGSVPVHIHNISFTGVPRFAQVTLEDMAGAEIVASPDYPIQLHPCDELIVIVHVHIDNTAPNVGGIGGFSFTGTIDAIQYNELPS